MRHSIQIVLIVLLFLVFPRLEAVATDEDYAVKLAATSTAAGITLSWSYTQQAQIDTSTASGKGILIRRRSPISLNGVWSTVGSIQGSAAPTTTSFTDSTAVAGTAYEYEVRITSSFVEAYGWAYAGYDLPLVEDRGKVVLLVDASLASGLASRLTRLERDLVGDGWRVVRHDVARVPAVDTSGWAAAVQSTKALLAADHAAGPVSHVFIIGRVPVPYSGHINEGGISADGHGVGNGSHIGAWPADGYYGDFNGTWTDVSNDVNVSEDGRNRNEAGDGKFDQSQHTGPFALEAAVGRVDLANMPSFQGVVPGAITATASATISGGAVTGLSIGTQGNGYTAAPTVIITGGMGRGARATATVSGGKVTGLTLVAGGSHYTSAPTVSIFPPDSVELALMQRYLDKNHAWRHAALPVQAKGLLRDGFDLNGKTAAAGYRQMGALVGAANITTVGSGAWFSQLTNPGTSYLFGYAEGGGTYTSADGVGNTANYAANDTRVVFTTHFGSFFGDWDSRDNFLRAPLGTPSYTLTSMWSGFPHCYFHPMGLGETTGTCARLSMNNVYTTASPALYSYKLYSSQGQTGVHLGLMGDPTLRLHPVRPVTALTAVGTGAASVALSWTAATAPGLLGYHVYRSTSSTGPFVRLTGETISTASPDGSPIAATSYIDHATLAGTSYTYLVRAITQQAAITGTYRNASHGVYVTAVAGGSATVVTGASPASGSTAGGTSVTIAGSNFTGATGVTFGGIPATNVTVVSANQITCIAPPHAAGTVDIVVTTPAGSGTATGGYTYIPPGSGPSISGLSPTSGPTAGGGTLTITGTGFTGASSVTFGGTAASGLVVGSETQVTCIIPARAAGVVEVVVTTSAGSALASYTYIDTSTTVPIATGNAGSGGRCGSGIATALLLATLVAMGLMRFGRSTGG